MGSWTCAEQPGLQEAGRNKVLAFCRSPGCPLVHAALVSGCLRARSQKKPSLYAACCVYVQIDVCKEEDSQRAPASHIHVIIYLSINFSVACFFFFFLFLLAMPKDLSSLTRDQTHAFCIGSRES